MVPQILYDLLVSLTSFPVPKDMRSDLLKRR